MEYIRNFRLRKALNLLPEMVASRGEPQCQGEEACEKEGMTVDDLEALKLCYLGRDSKPTSPQRLGVLKENISPKLVKVADSADTSLSEDNAKQIDGALQSSSPRVSRSDSTAGDREGELQSFYIELNRARREAMELRQSLRSAEERTMVGENQRKELETKLALAEDQLSKVRKEACGLRRELALWKTQFEKLNSPPAHLKRLLEGACVSSQEKMVDVSSRRSEEKTRLYRAHTSKLSLENDVLRRELASLRKVRNRPSTQDSRHLPDV